MTRSEMYSTIKENGWAGEFQTKYGKNFTQGKTIELEEFITSKAGSDYDVDAHIKDADAKTGKETREMIERDIEDTNNTVSKQAFIKLVTALQSESCIDAETAREILDVI